MLENLYKELKQDYSKYIIIIKSGNFYIAFNKDAIIINDLLNYTLNETKNGIKIVFPITGLEKLIKKTEEKNLNYLIIENNEVVIKKKFNFTNYNIFLIKEPKYRLIMSQNISDKLINHIISEYFLTDIFDKTLIKENIATRKNKGTHYGIKLLKKYLNELKNKDFYILKFDISKFFLT